MAVDGGCGYRKTKLIHGLTRQSTGHQPRGATFLNYWIVHWRVVGAGYRGVRSLPLTGGIMKEKPILFSPPMVRAILEGRKTQTRRIVKPQPDEDGLSKTVEIHGHNGDWFDTNERRYVCPYGQVGDRLWVRETILNVPEHGNFYYAADRKGVGYSVFEALLSAGKAYKKSIPSIHMHRWASRIDLEITGIRVERLWDTSEEDAKAEGIIEQFSQIDRGWVDYWPSHGGEPYATAKEAYRDLWDSINAKRGFGWDINPWVWVVEFQSVQNSQAQAV